MTQDDIDATKAPLLDHLIELRSRLIKAIVALLIAFIFCFSFTDQIYAILLEPYLKAEMAIGSESTKIITTAPQEFFFTKIKLGLFAGFCLSFPIIAYQIYAFIAPGLYSHEKKAFLPFIVATPVLFALGASLLYFFVLPMAFQFFLGLEQSANSAFSSMVSISNENRVSEYLSFVTTLIIAFGLAFQLPVLITLLATAGMLSAETLRKNRKFFIVGAFAAAAFLTPPDPISQIGLGLPILALYEISILVVALIEKRRSDESLTSKTA